MACPIIFDCMLFLCSRTICCQILTQIRNWIALGLELTGIKRHPSCCLRPDSGGMINIVRTKARVFDFFHREVSGQLMNDCSYDLQMSQFLSTDISENGFPHIIRHGVALRKVTHRSAHFSIRATRVQKPMGNFMTQSGYQSVFRYRKFFLYFMCQISRDPFSVPCQQAPSKSPVSWR